MAEGSKDEDGPETPPHDAERVFVAFSGGGAKGLVHLGALDVLESSRLDIRGYAGTSAGAIVAALAAAGFRRADLFDPQTGATLFHSLAAVEPELRSPTDLFGPDGWTKIVLLRSHGRLVLAVAAAAVSAPLVLAIILLAAGILPASLGIALLPVLLFLSGAAVYGLIHLTLGGLARLDRFRDALDRLLSRQMFGKAQGREVTFADFGKDTGRPALKIVATNLTRRGLALFSPETTPAVTVADAVAASICIPVIFKAWREAHSRYHYVDGGLVSNLPAWSFDSERTLDPDAFTLAIDIKDDPPAPITSPLSYLVALVRTALFGAAELNLRGAGASALVELETEVGLLDFDMSMKAAAATFEDARRAAKTKILKDVMGRRRLLRELCETLQATTRDYLEAFGLLTLPDGTPGTIRVALAMREPGAHHALRLRHGAGFADMPDQAIVLPLEGSLSGRAWRDGEVQFASVPFPQSDNLPGPENRRTRARIWKEQKWAACIPIWEHGANRESAAPIFVVTIDGDMRLDDEDDLTEQVVAFLAAKIGSEIPELLLDYDSRNMDET